MDPNILDGVISEIKKIKDDILEENYEITLDREKLEKKYIKANIFHINFGHKEPNIEILFGSNSKKLKIGNYIFFTKDKYTKNDFYDFYFSVILPNTKETWELLANFDVNKWYTIPDDTEVKVYTTSRVLTFTKGDIVNFEQTHWMLLTKDKFLLKRFFKNKTNILYQNKKHSFDFGCDYYESGCDCQSCTLERIYSK